MISSIVCPLLMQVGDTFEIVSVFCIRCIILCTIFGVALALKLIIELKNENQLQK